MIDSTVSGLSARPNASRLQPSRAVIGAVLSEMTSLFPLTLTNTWLVSPSAAS
jgi:hypothetical protein